MATERRQPARRLRSRGPEATEALGQGLGRVLEAGTILALSGELGTGKTAFVRGLARGLGVGGPVSSPSFTLMQRYEGGRLALSHFDAWMEGRERAWLADGGAEELGGEGVAAIEWAERVAEWLPSPHLLLELSHAGPRERFLSLSVVGAGPGARALERLVGALALPPGVDEIAAGGGEPPAARPVEGGR